MWKHGLVETDLRRTRDINQLNEMRREGGSLSQQHTNSARSLGGECTLRVNKRLRVRIGIRMSVL